MALTKNTDYHFRVTKECLKAGDIEMEEITATCVEIPSCHMSMDHFNLPKLCGHLIKLIEEHIRLCFLYKEEIPKPSQETFAEEGNVYHIPIKPQLRIKLIKKWGW